MSKESVKGVDHHLWLSDSRSAYKGICALRSSKPVPRCTAVRVESDRLLTQESEVKAHWAGYFERLIHQLSSWMSEVLLSQLLTFQSTVIYLNLWKHRLR